MPYPTPHWQIDYPSADGAWRTSYLSDRLHYMTSLDGILPVLHAEIIRLRGMNAVDGVAIFRLTNTQNGATLMVRL